MKKRVKEHIANVASVLFSIAITWGILSMVDCMGRCADEAACPTEQARVLPADRQHPHMAMSITSRPDTVAGLHEPCTHATSSVVAFCEK